MINNITLYKLFLDAKNYGYNQIEIEKLENALLENIREESVKKIGAKSELQVVKSIIKYNKKNNPNLAGYIEYKEKFGFTDGHRIIVVDSNFDYEKANTNIDIDKFKNDFSSSSMVRFEIDKNEIKNNIAINKAVKVPKPYKFYVNGTVCGVNAEYILNAIKCTGTNIFYCDIKTSFHSDYKCNINPYFQIDENNNILSVTLPICIKDSEKAVTI